MKRINIDSFKKFNIILFLILAVLFSYRLYLLDNVTTAGSDYLDKYNDLISLEKKNEKLKNEFYTLTSIKSIKARANELGYLNKAISYISIDELASSENSD